MNVPVITPKGLFYAEDRKTVVVEGDKRAAFLICHAGAQIPSDQLEVLGLLEKVQPRVLTDEDLAVITADKADAGTTAERKTRVPRDVKTR